MQRLANLPLCLIRFVPLVEEAGKSTFGRTVTEVNLGKPAELVELEQGANTPERQHESNCDGILLNHCSMQPSCTPRLAKLPHQLGRELDGERIQIWKRFGKFRSPSGLGMATCCARII